MKKHKLDQLFSDKLDNYQNQPSANAWEAIEGSLDSKSRKPAWIWIGIAASAALAVVSSWYMLSDNSINNTTNYAYSENQVEDIDVPREIILVPVFIQVPSSNELAVNQKVQIGKSSAPVPTIIDETPHKNIIITDNKVLEHQLAPVLQEPLPLVADAGKEVVIASAKEVIIEDQESTLEPLTIIYKQGKTAPKSNFTKALNYMEDVRNGDKKLVNFKKIGESIKSKFKSNKVENSK